MPYCEYCGNVIERDARFCPFCGRKPAADSGEVRVQARYPGAAAPAKSARTQPTAQLNALLIALIVLTTVAIVFFSLRLALPDMF